MEIFGNCLHKHARTSLHSVGRVPLTCICFINSNICSGGRLATALVISSGADCGGTGLPYTGGCSRPGWTGHALHCSTGQLGMLHNIQRDCMTVQGIARQSEGLQSLKTIHSLQLGLSLVVDLGERNNKKTLLTVALTYQSLLINTTSNTLMSLYYATLISVQLKTLKLSFNHVLQLSSHHTPLCLSSGAFAALSNFKRLPCNSKSWRFLIALCAVSWSWYSQKANPFDLPVCWSYTILRRLNKQFKTNTINTGHPPKGSTKRKGYLLHSLAKLHFIVR